MLAPSRWCVLLVAACLLAPSAARGQCTALAPPTGYAVSSCTNDTAVNSTCTITCGPGYWGTPTPGSSTCQAGNTWSATAFSGCAVITCPAPTAPMAYALSCGGGTQPYGSSCGVSCATGYTGTPTSATITCGGGGQWSPPPSDLSGCALVDCDAPAPPAGYALSCAGGTSYGASCTATCDTASGYLGTAAGTTTCQASGTWSAGSFSGCALADCGALPAPPAAYTSSCTGGTTFGAACSFACAPGYAGTPSTASATCQLAGWSANPAQLTGCAPVDCGVPVPPTGYALACGGGTTYGASCAAVCDTASGYVGTATGATTCQANTTWTAGSFAGCALAQCGPFSRAGYATSCTGTSFGGTCTIGCDAASGYVGTPSATSSTCQLDQQWSVPPNGLSGCALADCGALPAAPAGYSVSCPGGTSFGATCAFSCAAGYTGTPSSASSMCQLAGWSVDAALLTGCAPVDCGPLTLAGADVADCSAHSRFGESCAVACLAGHSGSPSATCTAAGTWSTTGACSAIPCWPSPDTNGDSCGSGGEVCLSGACASPAAGQLCAAPFHLDPGVAHTFALDGQHDLLAATRCAGTLAAGRDLFVEVHAGGQGCGNGISVEVDDASGIDAVTLDSCASTACATLDAEATATTLRASLDPALAGTVLLAVHVRGAPAGATGRMSFNPMCTDATPPSGGGGGGCGAAAPAAVALLWLAAAALARRKR